MIQRVISLCALVLSCLIPAHTAFANSTEYVYVESNVKTPGGNSIFAFKRNTDGSLTPLNNSPFLTHGAGVQDSSLALGPYDSDQNIAIDESRNLLFAVNSGSDTIAVFHIESDGSLQAVKGSPFASGGTNPVSVGLLGDILFVVNKNGDFPRLTSILPNYTAFRVATDGALSPLELSTRSVALGSSPTQALVVPGSKLLFGADFLCGLLQSFKLEQDHLRQHAPIALPASEFGDTTTPRLPLGLWAHPKLPLLYVGFVTVNRLGVYAFGEQGRLKFIRTVPNSGTAICWLRANRSGTRLYSADTGTNSVSVYDLSYPEEPTEIQNLVLAGPGNALQFSLSSDERYLYALTQRAGASIPEGQGNTLHILCIARDGTISEHNDPIIFHLPPGTRPQGVAVFTKH
jgi:6-phosphogluconolactonase (cycloisomerase 2 family)